jgi:hypothetical protein
MRYTVTWLPIAEETLAEIWNNASDRGDVTAAANAIDTTLARGAVGFGESRPDGKRVGFILPLLGVLFEVNEGDRIARVERIWRIQ